MFQGVLHNRKAIKNVGILQHPLNPLQLAVNVLITVIIKFNTGVCQICNLFGGNTFSAVLRHMGEIYRHDPGLVIRCGIGAYNLFGHMFIENTDKCFTLNMYLFFQL